MAIVFPEYLPDSITTDPLRSAERKTYESLKRLPDQYYVFYGVAWLGRSEGEKKDGEADFVVAHPDHGVLVLEVKGGTIDYNSKTQKWTSIDRNQVRHNIKDPAHQARKSKYALLKKLKEVPQWGNRWIAIGHAIVFPDVFNNEQFLRPDLPSDIIIDGNRIADPTMAIRDIFSFWQSRPENSGSLDADGIAVLADVLARSFFLHSPLRVGLDLDDEHIIRLTNEQMQLLGFLQHQRRAAIYGCAGSGKTMLALEKTHRLASQGFEVLLLCFNAGLARHLSRMIGANTTVLTFHSLCTMMYEKANLSDRRPLQDDAYFDEFLPSMLRKAIAEVGPQYDAIIVDEGQDFKHQWFKTLRHLLRDPENGVFYVFLDDNQNVYRDSHDAPHFPSIPIFTLNQNCRNTQRIHRLVTKFHPRGSELESRGPEGHKPKRITYSPSHSLHDRLAEELERLVTQESLSTHDLVILTPRSESRSFLRDNLNIGNLTLCRAPCSSDEQVLVSTIHAFKGLESKAIILAEIDDAAGKDLSKLLYIGYSRARTYLVVINDSKLPARYLRSPEGWDDYLIQKRLSQGD